MFIKNGLSVGINSIRRQLHLPHYSCSSVSHRLTIYYLTLTTCFCRITLLESKPWTNDIYWTHIRRSKDVLEVFWTPYVRWTYVECPVVTSWTFNCCFYSSLEKCFSTWDHSFSTYVEFSDKLTSRTCAYHGVRNVSFSKNFMYKLN